MPEDENFVRCVELLLNNGIICHVSHPDLYLYLRPGEAADFVSDTLAREPSPASVNEHYNRVRIFLEQIGRTLETTSDGRGIYCVALDADDQDVQREALKLFEETVSKFEPLIKWLRLMRSAADEPRPLKAGDVIKSSDVYRAVEDDDALCARMREIDELLNGKVRDTQKSKALVNAVLKKLTEMGYLVEKGSIEAKYQATARWSLFYDVLEYVCQAEGWAEEEPQPEAGVQTELF